MVEIDKTTIKDQYYKDRDSIDSNDKRQIEYLKEFEREQPDDKF